VQQLWEGGQAVDEDEVLEEVPEWVEGNAILVQFVHCPLYLLCKFTTSFVEEWDDEDEARKHFEDHWREHHGGT
jgi:hypothetical protein